MASIIAVAVVAVVAVVEGAMRIVRHTLMVRCTACVGRNGRRGDIVYANDAYACRPLVAYDFHDHDDYTKE